MSLLVGDTGCGWCAWLQACVWMEHEWHINAIRRGPDMQAVKFLRVKVPCPFTRKSNECITEATGWSQCRVVHLHLSVCRFPPCRSSPHVRHPLQNRGCADIVPEHVGLPWEMVKICIIVRWIGHFAPQRWTVHFHIPARSSDVTCEAFLKNQTWRHCIENQHSEGIICIWTWNTKCAK